MRLVADMFVCRGNSLGSMCAMFVIGLGKLQNETVSATLSAMLWRDLTDSAADNMITFLGQSVSWSTLYELENAV